MRISPQAIARIKACKGVYTVGDTARHFGVSKSTVHDVWQGRRHPDVPEAIEAPNVISSRVSPEIIIEDARTLLERHNGDVAKAAVDLGVHQSTLYRHIKKREVNVGLYVA